MVMAIGLLVDAEVIPTAVDKIELGGESLVGFPQYSLLLLENPQPTVLANVAELSTPENKTGAVVCAEEL